MTRKKLLAILLIVLIFFLTQTELRSQTAKDSTRTILDLSATGNVQTGNFERLQLINQLDFSMDSKDRKWNFHSRHLHLYQRV